MSYRGKNTPMENQFQDGMDELVNQAKKMQDNMQQVQQDLTDLTVVGRSGGGLVEVIMNGRYGVKSVSIDPSTLDADQQEFLEDLIAAATNDAVSKVEEASRNKMMSLTKGLKFPADFKNPFQNTEEK